MQNMTEHFRCDTVCQRLMTIFGKITISLHFPRLSTAVLVLYFKFFLQWDNDLATSIYHTFVALCYLTPILGAIVADSWLGKFK